MVKVWRIASFVTSGCCRLRVNLEYVSLQAHLQVTINIEHGLSPFFGDNNRFPLRSLQSSKKVGVAVITCYETECSSILVFKGELHCVYYNRFDYNFLTPIVGAIDKMAP